MSDQKIKTIRFDFNDPDDRNAAFDRICELRCLDKTQARIDLKITGGNIPHQKIIELARKQECNMILAVEVPAKEAVGSAAIKAPDSISSTSVDEIPPIKNQSMDSGFDEPGFEDDSDPAF